MLQSYDYGIISWRKCRENRLGTESGWMVGEKRSQNENEGIACEGRGTAGSYIISAASELKSDFKSLVKDFSTPRFIVYLEIYFSQVLNCLLILMSFVCQ